MQKRLCVIAKYEARCGVKHNKTTRQEHGFPLVALSCALRLKGVIMVLRCGLPIPFILMAVSSVPSLQ